MVILVYRARKGLYRAPRFTLVDVSAAGLAVLDQGDHSFEHEIRRGSSQGPVIV